MTFERTQRCIERFSAPDFSVFKSRELGAPDVDGRGVRGWSMPGRGRAGAHIAGSRLSRRGSQVEAPEVNDPGHLGVTNTILPIICTL